MVSSHIHTGKSPVGYFLQLSNNAHLDGPERSEELPEDVLFRLRRQVVHEDAPAAPVDGGRRRRGPARRAVARRGRGGRPGSRRRPGQDGVAGQEVAGQGGVPATQWPRN